jgi:uncharacterized protein (AIM24 family)
MTHEIIGDDMQAVVLTLGPADEVRAEAGAMTYMTDGVEMDARMQGGLLGGINVEFTKRLGAGFFGGEGFILQRLEGTGDVFVHSGGTIVPMELKAGETVRVDTGCLVAFDPTVDYDTEFVGGVKTALFGGEGLFFAKMTGPGRVFVQTLPFSRLADRIMHAYKRDREDVKRDFGGTLGAIGDLIGGDR